MAVSIRLGCLMENVALTSKIYLLNFSGSMTFNLNPVYSVYRRNPVCDRLSLGFVEERCGYWWYYKEHRSVVIIRVLGD